MGDVCSCMETHRGGPEGTMGEVAGTTSKEEVGLSSRSTP